VAGVDRRARIEAALRERLAAEHVEVVDESHLHAGHAGARDGRGHFRALVVSARFEGLSRVAAQRLVYDSLADELRTDIHALSLRTLTPAEWRRSQRTAAREDAGPP
jgi:BolA protein